MGEIFERRASAEATLADVLAEVWAGRGFVLGGLAMGLVLAFAAILICEPHSRAQIVIAPASPLEERRAAQGEGANTRSSAVAQASLNFEKFQSVAKGAAVASLLLRSPEIVRGLERDRDFVFTKGRTDWRPEVLAEYIARRVQFVPVGETPLRAMRYAHPDPAFAVLFLQRLHAVSDGVVRHAVRSDVNERVDYLRQESQSLLNPEHRRVLTDLLLEQERLRMLVSIDQPYAALVVEPAYSSSRAVWPDVPLMMAGFMAAGALAGFVAFSARAAARVRARPESRDERFRAGDLDDDLDDDHADEAHQARERLRRMRGWNAGRGENQNERPLSGKKGRKAPPFSNSAAE